MVLITGGTGAIGFRLINALKEKGHAVRLFTLPDDPGAEKLRDKVDDIRYGDIRTPDDLGGICEGVDTVYHLAAVILSPDRPQRFTDINVRGTEHLAAEARRAGVDHFIYVSSASVTYPRGNRYAESKRQAEAVVKDAGLPHVTVLRPTLVYQENGSAEFVLFVNYLKRFPVVPFIGTGTAKKAPVHADDLADGMAAVAGNEAAYGKTYNLSGGEAVTMRAMADQIMTQAGCRKPVVPVPVWICRILAVCATAWARLTGNRPLLTWQTVSGIIQDADLDNADARRDLGYAPRKFSDGVRQLAFLKPGS